MVSLAALKAKRGSNLKELQERLQHQTAGQARDERIWKPTLDKKAGKSVAVVRFIPNQYGDPFVRVMSYSFNGPGGNYYDLALQTIGQKDPIQLAAISAFRKAKNDDDKALKAKAMRWLPRRRFYANVVVLKDEMHPDNEGKVFIFEFGQAIYNKLEEVIVPKFEDQEPLDPFDLWNGADFRIRMIAKEIPDSQTGKPIQVPNYDNSEFDKVTAFLGGDDDKLDAIYKQAYDLNEFIDPKKFKSVEEVEKRFEQVMGHPWDWLSNPSGASRHAEKLETRATLVKEQTPAPETPAVESHDEPIDMSDDEEDPVERFKRMAKGL